MTKQELNTKVEGPTRKVEFVSILEEEGLDLRENLMDSCESACTDTCQCYSCICDAVAERPLEISESE